MDNWSFGLTMMIVGVGGTFLTLWVLGLFVDLLKKSHIIMERVTRIRTRCSHGGPAGSESV